MGGSFFGRGGLSNAQTGGVQGVVGQNSGLGRAIANDPIHSFLFGKPQAIPATAGPYAGVAPTLAGAASGYGVGSNGQPAAPGGYSQQLMATFGPQGGAPAARPQMGLAGMGGKY